MLTKVGDDLFGQQTISRLKNEGILTDYVLIDSRYPSGVALITVDEERENTIVVASGANMAFLRKGDSRTYEPHRTGDNYFTSIGNSVTNSGIGS
ncbi:PfkB family carbohydrate kinase [Gloeothece citriformis]|uniref:PfkB family carbohydrate kinase n=1 Tax=Gloeothece citriformis TaxID=2546356 RepID=UPI000676A924|nr:PfkB family carbohydrate kinase [Gloeothece citriformis]